MIIYSLLFIIILIFVYETVQRLFKLREEYFSNARDHFIANPLPSDPSLADISKTIAINCKAYPAKANSIQAADISPHPGELDTPYYAQFKPLEYNPRRLYYFRRDILIPEGWRRSADDDIEIANVQALYNQETDPAKKEILQDELDLFNWRSTILAEKDKKGISRSMRDITTDYYPAELGMQRIWREPHSHIRDYSHELNYGYKAYSKSNSRGTNKSNNAK
jgi:hypothetical protein